MSNEYADESIGVKCEECYKLWAVRRCNICGMPVCEWDVDSHRKKCEEENKENKEA